VALEKVPLHLQGSVAQYTVGGNAFVPQFRSLTCRI